MCKWSGEASLRPLWGFRSQEESRLSPLEHCPTRHSPPQFMPHINLHPPLIHNQTPSIHEASSACIIYVSYVSRTSIYHIYQQTITSKKDIGDDNIMILGGRNISFTSWDRFFSSLIFIHFYRTRVRSLAMLVSNWLTDSHWLPLRRLDWYDPGVWRCQLKTCWGCVVTVANVDDERRVECCRQIGADLKVEVWS